MDEQLDIPQQDQQVPEQTPDKPVLPPDKRKELHGIVSKMILNKESEDNIKLVIDHYTKKNLQQQPSAPKIPQSNITPAPTKENNFLPMAGIQTVDEYTQKAQERHDNTVNDAKKTIGNVIDNDNVLKPLAHKMMVEQRQSDLQNAAGADVNRGVTDSPVHIATQFGLPVQPNEVDEFSQAIKDNPDLQIKTLVKAKNEHPEKAADIDAALYVKDSNSRAVDPIKQNQISENAQLIKDKKLIYKPQTRQLIKPEGLGESLHTASQKRNEDMELFDLADNGSKEDLIKKLNEITAQQDPDKPVPTPSGFGGHIGEFAGGQGKITAEIAAAQALNLLAPGSGEVVSAGLYAHEFARRGYANELQRSYGEFKRQGLSDNDALEKAQAQAKNAMVIDAATSAVMGKGTGASTNLLKSAPVKEAVKLGSEGGWYNGVIKNGFDFLKKEAPVGIKNASLAGGGEIAKNISANANGENREVTEGAAGAAGNMLALHYTLSAAMGLAANGLKESKGLYQKTLQGFTKVPLEDAKIIANEQVQAGNITPQAAAEVLQDIERHKEIDQQIPKSVKNDEVRLELHKKIERANELAEESKTVYSGAREPIKAKIEAIDKEINEKINSPEAKEESPKQEPEKPRITVSTPNIVNVKLKDHALSEQSANALDVQPETGNGEAMGSGNAQSKELAGTQEEPIISNKEAEQPQGVGSEAKLAVDVPPPSEPNANHALPNDENFTKMANAINDAHVEGKFGVEALDKVMSKMQDTDTKNIYEKVKDKIKRGVLKPKDVRERLITTKQGSEEDQATLLYDLAELKGRDKELTKEINLETDPSKITSLQRQKVDIQNEIMDNALANRSIGRTASNIFRLRQLWVDKDTNIADMVEEYKASKGVKELTPEQQKEVQDAYNDRQNLKIKLDEAKEGLNKAIEENKKLSDENERLKELQKNTTKQKKADRGKKNEEIIKKSNERISAAKERLRKLGGNLNAGVNPQVALEIGKIAAEKFYQGIVKFDELVKNVFDDIKDILPQLDIKEVRSILLNNTKSEEYYKSLNNLSISDKALKDKILAYRQLQKDYALQVFKWQKERRMDIMDKRPVKEKIIDNILRWQRFAVLSYPSTILKLGAVVGHQLTLKPFKFVIQKAVSALTPESITSKQTIWGDPKLSSLGKYYSAFIRNFALQNLKEHFGGVDTKEIMYGKGHNYEEWASAKGLLEMPGRSHGYIKSFIKNPEFQYAHEQQTTGAISKMVQAQEKLKDTKLTPEEKQKWEEQYNNNDITNDEVMDRINKLSLDHGKWAILMNDNKFVEKFRDWTNHSGITGALIKSELPVLKIPINYVSRAFMTKYGLIAAITGRGEKMPSVIKLIKDGTKDLTPEQADMLGKSLTLGTMGASFFLLGYFNHKNVKENDDGSIQLFGHHISKSLIHSPEFESIFSGAVSGNQYNKSKKQNFGSWAKSYLEGDIDIAEKSPFTSMLKYGFLPNVATVMLNTKNKDKVVDKVEDAVFKKVSDMAIPGFIKQPAGWMDTGKPGVHPTGTPVKRKPKGDVINRFWEQMELGIPKLRENVHKDSKKSSNRK